MADKSPSGRGDVVEPEWNEKAEDSELKRKPKPRTTRRKPKKKKHDQQAHRNAADLPPAS
jgi:hypothetical protein